MSNLFIKLNMSKKNFKKKTFGLNLEYSIKVHWGIKIGFIGLMD